MTKMKQCARRNEPVLSPPLLAVLVELVQSQAYAWVVLVFW
jgi:hypothetical protein